MMILAKARPPLPEQGLAPIALTNATVCSRREAVLAKMREEGLDALIVYGDMEHGSNWEYLTGFLTRFEEALLVLYPDGSANAVLGNENLNKAEKSLLPMQAVHMPHFSLPNQPMNTDKNVDEILAETGIGDCASIGVVGWKLFTSKLDDNSRFFDIPCYLMEALRRICPKAEFKNVTGIFIGEGGVRTVNNANEFAHYEFGAALAGNGIITAMDAVRPGVTELELGALLNQYGQRNSVITIATAGERFERANLYPTGRAVRTGDKLSLTVGFKGGLQSRVGYAVESVDQLPVGSHDYLEKVAIPYQNAVKTWLESIHVGMSGADLYQCIENALPKKQYGWYLNPGHLCADEEWLASPIYPGSAELLRSGMLLQIDIIPSVAGYNGASCESGVLIANDGLREQIKADYPELWVRVERRRAYLEDELGIHMHEDVLPTSIATAYYRPFMLDHERVLKDV